MCASNIKRITFVATTHLPYSESEWKRVQLCVCGKKATKQKNKLKLYFIVGVSNCLKPVELYTFNIVLYMACVWLCVSICVWLCWKRDRKIVGGRKEKGDEKRNTTTNHLILKRITQPGLILTFHSTKKWKDKNRCRYCFAHEGWFHVRCAIAILSLFLPLSLTLSFDAFVCMHCNIYLRMHDPLC